MAYHLIVSLIFMLGLPGNHSLFGGTPDVNFEKFFHDKTGCFELADVKTGKVIQRFGDERCRLRQSACSTFKVPLALIAFDQNLLSDTKQITKWDGTNYGMPGWQKDQTPKTWIQESTVWYSQILTEKLGTKKLQSYLDKFDYGSKDISGGLQTAWLTRPNSPSTLLISADQQIKFLMKMYQGRLDISKKSLEQTKEIIFIETLEDNWLLSGKTGSGNIGPTKSQRLGWFVAHLKKGPQEFVGVVTFTDKKPNQPGFAGPEARDIFKQIWKQHGQNLAALRTSNL